MFRIGTRGSPLALAQAQLVRDALVRETELTGQQIEIVPITTRGDRYPARSIGRLGGKGVFCREIELALADCQIDIAVHSMKDMPASQPQDLVIDCVLPRENPQDALISTKFSKISDLPEGTVVGTSSVRRKAQLLRQNPCIRVVAIRGNLGTRLSKLARGEVDATILAMAGINRLQQDDVPATPIPVEHLLPAPGQATICIERRSDDSLSRDRLSRINHQPSYFETQAERAFIAQLGGSCTAPVGALARHDGVKLHLVGEALHPEGTSFARAEAEGSIEVAREVGLEVAQKVLKAAESWWFSIEPPH